MITGSAALRQVGNFNFMVENSDLRFHNDKVYIEVNGGWYTDGGSIPKVFHNIISPLGGKQLYGFIVHDALWLMRVKDKGLYTMQDTNKIMEQIHKESGVSWWKRKLIQLGVSKWTYFAWKKWNNPSKEVVEWDKDIIHYTCS